MRGKRSLIVSLVALGLVACSNGPSDTFQGYGEGEYVYVSSPYAGRLETLDVARGAQVAARAPLFVIEHGVEQAAVDAAEAKVQSADAVIANLVGAKRKPEIDALRAQIESATAALKLAKTQLDQKERLRARGYVTQEALDVAKSNYERDAAQLAQMQAQLRAGLQSIGRQSEIDAARANLDAARAELAQAKVKLEQKIAVAPAAALVQDTFFREGEWVPAGNPVVSLLPPGNVKVRFFVPEAVVGRLQVGDPVRISCDGCATAVAARISFVSPQAEYTPPVIYSRESRAKLVFMIEARPDVGDARKLHPGQPVDVKLEAGVK
ncbi:MAG: HlyD family efflux transporter periplasmic adaptor subunit [Betaproteobacteria bacterium]|jgi:HlyD family secretion protein|nr:HlyD family efflux transporter periplasmic adaptor subunit [Betaproteobacteria bacterium]